MPLAIDARERRVVADMVAKGVREDDPLPLEVDGRKETADRFTGRFRRAFLCE
jgi:hypothetical protein